MLGIGENTQYVAVMEGGLCLRNRFFTILMDDTTDHHGNIQGVVKLADRHFFYLRIAYLNVEENGCLARFFTLLNLVLFFV